MTSCLHSKSLQNNQDYSLRRSDRKKTKKIFKDDFIIPNPFKNKGKKQKSLTLPLMLDSQIRKIQYLTEQSLSKLNFGKHQFSEQMLFQMKQAVNNQQSKLTECLQIKLKGEKNALDDKLVHLQLRQQRFKLQKQNTPKFQQSSINSENLFDSEINKENMAIATAQQLQYSKFIQDMEVEQDFSAFGQDSQYGLPEMDDAPKFRKQSSKLLSDNYQNNELFYTLDHLTPNWHRDEIDFENPEDQFQN